MIATTQSHVAVTQTVKQHNSLRRYPLAERKGYIRAALRLEHDSGVSCNSGKEKVGGGQ